MNGGRISDNTSTNGGGVYFSKASFITGKISKNTANNNGGGIYAAAGVIFQDGLTSIEENTSKGSNSYGGVYFTSAAGSQSLLVLEDIISGNSGFGSENNGEHNWTERGPMLGE
jgi:predicted outer membrane repeat protein